MDGAWRSSGDRGALGFGVVAMSAPVPLTARQESILRFILDEKNRKGYPPSNREIGAAFGIRSTNGVADHLKALERKGWIKRAPMIARGMRVLFRPAVRP